MGKHDTHPIFTGYHLEKLGYYTAANIQTLMWDRNPSPTTSTSSPTGWPRTPWSTATTW